ncbi:MAG TPA: hypothetical protein VII23_18290 [Terriglobales bacterium]|jgi:hypothetical protein
MSLWIAAIAVGATAALVDWLCRAVTQKEAIQVRSARSDAASNGTKEASNSGISYERR